MSYVEKNLIAGERVLYITGLHWIVMFWPVVLGLFFGLPGLIFLILSVAGKAENAAGGAVAGLVLLVIGAISLTTGIVKQKATEMAVTNKRVLVKTGFLSRSSFEILLSKIESIGIEEGIVGRMLGYGSVLVRGTGGTPEPFHNISRPSEFRRQVQSQIEQSALKAS